MECDSCEGSGVVRVVTLAEQRFEKASRSMHEIKTSDEDSKETLTVKRYNPKWPIAFCIPPSPPKP